MPDGSPGIFDQIVQNVTGRLTWQASPRNKVSAYMDRAFKALDRELSPGEDPMTSALRRTPVLYYTAAVKWTSTVSNRLLLQGGWGAGRSGPQLALPAGHQADVGHIRLVHRTPRGSISIAGTTTVGRASSRERHDRPVRDLDRVSDVHHGLAQREGRNAVAVRDEHDLRRTERRPDSTLPRRRAGFGRRLQLAAVRERGHVQDPRGHRPLRAGHVEPSASWPSAPAFACIA